MLRLIEDWYRMIYRLWSIRIALFWGGVCGVYTAWPAFQDTIPPLLFTFVSMLMCMAIAAARVTKQPGLDE